MNSSTGPTASIHDLPAEMICELFKYLPPKDLAACSLVNKRWHSIFAAFKLRKLAVIGRSPRHGLDRLIKWSYPDQRIEEAEQCRLVMFRRLVKKPLLSNLTHLAVSGDRVPFDLNMLNQFEKLVHLEIYIYFDCGVNVHLKLPKLKVLAFHEWNYRCVLKIDCPLLSTLVYRCEKIDTDLLKVKQPETIQKLDTNLFYPTKLARFKHVACLVTREFRAISKTTLLSLPELRELHYNVAIEDSIGRAYADQPTTKVDYVKRTLSEFLDEAKKLRGSDFRLTFCGFDLTKVNMEQIDFDVQVDARYGDERVHNEYVYLKNYRLIEPGALHFVKSINYTGLRDVRRAIPRCFFQKFTGIKEVFATTEVRSPDHFLRFLSSLRLLKRLVLTNAGLSQKFYDQLPASAPLLVILILRSGHCKNGLQLNFDFTGGLSHLSELEIEESYLSLKSSTSLVRTLAKSGKFGELAWCVFFVRSKECVLKIVKHRYHQSPAPWAVEGSQWLFETMNPEEILNFLDGHQEYTPVRSAVSD